MPNYSVLGAQNTVLRGRMSYLSRTFQRQRSSLISIECQQEYTESILIWPHLRMQLCQCCAKGYHKKNIKAKSVI
jgi:hypothetical protein